MTLKPTLTAALCALAYAGAALAAPPPLPQASQYLAGIDGEAAGPFSLAELEAMLASGEVSARTLIWRDGQENWTPLSAVITVPQDDDAVEAEPQRDRVGPPPLPVTQPPPPPEGERGRPTSIVFYISEDERSHGPYTVDDLFEMLSDGRVTGETLLWSDGMEDWTPYRVVATEPRYRTGDIVFPPPPAPPMPEDRSFTDARCRDLLVGSWRHTQRVTSWDVEYETNFERGGQFFQVSSMDGGYVPVTSYSEGDWEMSGAAANRCMLRITTRAYGFPQITVVTLRYVNANEWYNETIDQPVYRVF